MTAPNDVAGFFGATSGKGISFPNAGDSVTGIITAIHPPEQQTDPATQSLSFDKNGRPKMQVRIDLLTELRDSGIEHDDGSRTLYVRGWMKGSVGDALRKAGEKEPRIGGKLTVTFTHQEAPSAPGLSGVKKFDAVYEPPLSAAGQHFAEPAKKGAKAPAKPSGISDAAWAGMDAATKASVAKSMSDDNTPPF